ncbi:unnamed protein product [Adineta ricciae]|uniref:Uncharacterized protein n=1 Tax=Adineta ricciae TaxID=249248 RepID=A0A814VW06_ADIRI|nr:unnamed protein product [Adineta ricciae]
MAESISRVRINRFKRLFDMLSKINLFEKEDTMSVNDQLLSTRFFIFLLTLALIIVFTVTTFYDRTESVTIDFPSEDKFRTLSIHYLSTLTCPCTQISTQEDQVLSFNPQYHPICTSYFVNDSFILSLSNLNISRYFTGDYRVMLTSHFQTLALLCRTVKKLTFDAINEFGSEQLITTHALSSNIFNATVKELADQLKSKTMANLKQTSDFVWLNILQNGIYSGLRTNYKDRLSPPTNLLISSANTLSTSTKTCYCERGVTCVDQAELFNFTGWKEGFNPFTNKSVFVLDVSTLTSIPGLMMGCLPYDSLLHSTLECFSDQPCIDTLRYFTPEFPFVSAISSSSRYLINSTVKILLDELFIESWYEQSNFSAHYRSCSPSSCTYFYNRRINLVHAITTIISLFGGFNTVIKFCVPFIIRIFRRLQRCRQHLDTTIETVVETKPVLNLSLKNRLLVLINQVKAKIVTLNIFPPSSDIIDDLYSTRVYLVSMAVGLSVLIFYTSISIQTRSITVDKPSLGIYEQLYRRYPATLICPCTYLSIPYSLIIHLQPHYHQVCSSDFVRDDKWFLYFVKSPVLLFASDFRNTGLRLFTLLQTFCVMSNETISNELTGFNYTRLVSGNVLPRNVFDEQTSTIIRQFQQQVHNLFDSDTC